METEEQHILADNRVKSNKEIKNNRLNSFDNNVAIGAYVYPGWHSCPERDRHFPPGWSEWDLVLNAPSRFPDHNQPRLPVDGTYDGSDPSTAQKWLKDRKGRELSYEDILHYQKIIVALTETDRLMKEIDKIQFVNLT